MFLINDIVEEGRKIVGACSEQKFLAWCSDVVTMIANKGDFEAFKGYLDICTAGCPSCESTGTSCNRHDCGRRCVALPREVETVIGVNIDGIPSLGFGQLFNFHLNGPGDRMSCDRSWQDLGQFYSTYRDLITPSKLVAYLQTAEDNGKQFIVYGYDSAGNKLRREVSGQWLDGYAVPTIYGVALPDAEAPLIARITAVFKDESVGTFRLSTIDDSGITGVTLGIYEPDERLPQFRRIRVNRPCSWLRIAYRKSSMIFRSRWDHVPLKSRLGFLLGLQARKNYSDLDLAGAHGFEADATRLELEAQQQAEAPTLSPVQVVDRAQNLREKCDYDIV